MHETHRNLSLDSLKVILACMVVGIHTGFLSEISPATSYLMVNGLFRMAVPIFFMISGYYLEKIPSTKFTHWLRRALQLYLIWMALYSYFWLWTSPYSRGIIIKDAVLGFYHLWYLQALIISGIVINLMRRITSRSMLILAVVLFFFGASAQYISAFSLSDIATLNKLFSLQSFTRNFLFMGLPFMILGFLIARHEAKIQLSQGSLVGFSLIAMFLVIVESRVNFATRPHGGNTDFLYTLLFACPLLFLLASYNFIATRTRIVSHTATAIYLVHIAILLLLRSQLNLSESQETLMVIVGSVLLAIPLIILKRFFPIL